MSLYLFALLMIASLLAATGQVLFKLGASGRSGLLDYLNPWLLVGFFCYGAGAVLWIYCLSSLPLVKVYPFTALVLVLTILAGVFLLNETTSTTYWYGIVCILAGLYLVMK